jgi:tRNA 2-thiouridine synthesizing protein A
LVLTLKVKPDRILDCIGLYCPEPVYRTRMELDQMKVGEILEVNADDPAAEEDIKSLVRNLEQELIDVSKEGDAVKIQIKRIR